MGSDFLPVLCCVFVGVILRWSVTQFPYSGEGKPPKYGDYEAQRHWMEVTTNLPIEEWYVDGPQNDLQYWGLDYPPLSAFHSYGLGLIFSNILPESVQLYSSRGFESLEHKFWMRLSVLLSDVLLIGFLVFFVLSKRSGTNFPKWTPVLLALMAPPFILIDYAHFQYNCISLGLTVLAIACIEHYQMSFAAILFTLAVNHKQMSLYHAIPFFIQMVSVVLVKQRDYFTAFRVGMVIASTMGLMWLPFGDAWIDVLHRLFPIKRGVYEDKVGSFWYVLDRVIQLKGRLPDAQVAQFCAITSALILLPGIVHHFQFAINKKSGPEDSQKVFILSLLNTSLGLFLFSYHVHEKSIMLAVLPAVLAFPWFPFETVWFTVVASLSLYPLLLEEGSHVALLCITIVYVLTALQLGAFSQIKLWIGLVFLGSILGYVSLILGLHFIPPPPKLPHIYQSGIAIYSFLHYAIFSIYFYWAQFGVGTPVPSPSQKQPQRKRKKK